DHSSRRPARIRRPESRPWLLVRDWERAFCSESSAQTRTTRTFPRERQSQRDKRKLQRTSRQSLQLILCDLFHISCVLSFLLIFGTETKRFRINGNFLNRSSKLIVSFFIIVRHRRFIVHPYINSFVARIKVGLRLWYFPFSDFLPIYGQNGLPTSSRFTSIKHKLVLNSMFTSGNRFGRSNVSVLKSEIVVFVMKLASFHIKRPSSK